MLGRTRLTELVLGPGQGPLPPGPLRKRHKSRTHPAGACLFARRKVSLTCSFPASDPPWSWEGASFRRNSAKQAVKRRVRRDPNGPKGRPELWGPLGVGVRT